MVTVLYASRMLMECSAARIRVAGRKMSAAVALVALAIAGFNPAELRAQVTPDEPEGQALIERLRQGDLVVFFRHADTTGMPCDRLYRIGQREGQRNISEDGKEQSRQIGEALAALNIPIQEPVLAGPVFRARDTAEIAFGAERVEITDSLLADDYPGSRGVSWIIAEHRRLVATLPPPGLNRILVGHRTPALLSVDGQVNRSEFPEGAAIVIRPFAGRGEVLGVISFVPPPNPGVDRC
jgi:phosphohistidine phosphatase SixA